MNARSHRQSNPSVWPGDPVVASPRINIPDVVGARASARGCGTSRRWAQGGLLALASLLSAATFASEAPRVLPVLSQDSGRVEAVLLLDEPENAVPSRSLDRVLPLSRDPAATPLFDIKLGNSSRLSTSLSLDAQPGLALLCKGNIGLAAALGSLSEQCLLADLGTTDPLLGSLSQRARLGGRWESAGGGLDVTFGLSWLQAEDRSSAALWSPELSQPLMPAELAISQTALYAPQLISSRSVGLAGVTRFGESGWIGLEGVAARSSSRNTFQALPVRWDSTALRLAGGFGAISGTLTGRLINIPDADRSSFDLDVGVSWQAPWRARVTIGARNLLGNPDPGQWPLVSLPEGSDRDTRTPYIRYRQDL